MAKKPTSGLSGKAEVDKFMLELGHPLKMVVASLRELILKTDKTIEENIKWNAPSFRIDGDDRITLNLSKKDVVLIIFHRGAKAKDAKGKETFITDSTGLLEWLSVDRAVAKFKSVEEVESKSGLLKIIVKLWIKANKLQ